MKPSIFLIAGLIFYGILILGIPLKLKVGALSLSGDKMIFLTNSASLAYLFEVADDFEVVCAKSGKICATPSTESRFRPGVPIQFEPCFFVELSQAASCEEPQLNVLVSTRGWLLTSLGGK